MTQNSNIFDPAFDEILRHVNKEATALKIEFYLAGAVARDYHLNKLANYTPSRKTADIDIAVMVTSEVEFSKLKESLIQTGNFEEHNEPIKLIYKKSIELDLLPFGDIEKEGITTLTKPKIFVLDMPGFAILNKYAEQVQWSDEVNARVCSIEGIVLLKLIANNDRPERTKDLIDIQQIILIYFEAFSDDVYEHHFDLMEKYNTSDRDYIQQVSAHVIGRKLKKVLNSEEDLMKRIIHILKDDKDLYWKNILSGLTE
ncbi:MAG: nucleotidyl transferase AbiEii/AbiGii toxin family protein [Bacteroidia bacterium]|nr:nucleotidyl transferase AbiEii/AbiGii toxin family protein [Bacteroidia bacterium]